VYATKLTENICLTISDLDVHHGCSLGY